MGAGLIVGIDPGLSGGIAFLDPAGALRVLPMPVLQAGTRNEVDRLAFARLIDSVGLIEAAYVEKSGVMPGEGAVGAFSYGHGRGVLIGVLSAHFIRIEQPAPVTWKRAMGIKAGSGKDVSRAMAQNWWPRQSGEFSLKKFDGKAEAALIAFYGWKKENGKLAA